MNENSILEFYYIWDSWILSTIEEIYNQMDPVFKEKTRAKPRNLDEIKEKAAVYYCQKRNELKKQYYGDVTDGRRMDFHKLSAVLCRTMMEYKVFEFDLEICEALAKNESKENTDWLVHNALINFRLAFYVSIVFLYQSTLFDLAKTNPNLYELLKKQRRFNLYTGIDTDKKHESFENSLVLNLAKRNVQNRSFDYLMYSTIMYQLEEYNKLLLTRA